MPVLVTAAEHPLARRVAARLLEEGGEVRAYTSADASALRAAGAFIATGEPDDEGRLEAALADVHTLVHVGGGAFTSPERIAAEAEVAARAASNAGVQRVVALSLPGAHEDADDEVRRAKGAAEAALASVPAPTVIIRVGLVDTPGLRDAVLTAGFDLDVMDSHVAPVRPEDVAELIAAFDRARSRSPDGRLVVSANGPRWLSVAEYLDQVVEGEAARVGRRLPDPEISRRLADLLTGVWHDDTPGIVDAWTFTRITPEAPGPGRADAV